MTWNEKLVSLRSNKTVEQVSNDTGISPNMYLAYEQGLRIPPKRVKEILADYYQIQAEKIFENS